MNVELACGRTAGYGRWGDVGGTATARLVPASTNAVREQWTEPRAVVGFEGSSVPYSPLVMAAWSLVSMGSLSRAMDSSER